MRAVLVTKDSDLYFVYIIEQTVNIGSNYDVFIQDGAASYMYATLASPPIEGVHSQPKDAPH